VCYLIITSRRVIGVPVLVAAGARTLVADLAAA
jgi:hypothetical protein